MERTVLKTTASDWKWVNIAQRRDQDKRYHKRDSNQDGVVDV